MTKGLKIAAIAVVVGVVTYVGLEVLLPHHTVEVKLNGLVPVDSVFDSKLKSPDEVAAAAGATPGAMAVDDSATTPSGPAVASDDAMAPPADETVDEGSAPDAGTAADDSDSSVANDDTAADAGSADSTAAESTSPTPEPAAPAAAPAKPAVKPAAKASKPAAAKPAAKKAPATAAASASPWWTSSSNSDGLHVIYVGSAAFDRAVVVMGNAPFASASSANQNIHVSDASGKAVAGSWKLGSSNKAMLVFPVSKSGKFQIAVGAGLSDAKNRKLGQSVKGPVVIQ